LNTFIKHIIFLGLLAALFTSCEKEEKPITLPPAVGKKVSVDMGHDYAMQIYVNLNGDILSTIRNDAWDIAFDASPHGSAVLMNGGNNALIATVGLSQFKPIHEPSSLTWRWDSPGGQHDSIVLNNWHNRFGYTYDSVYLIDRGVQYTTEERYYQFKLTYVDIYHYIIAVGDLSGEPLYEFIIEKDHSKKFVYFSFQDKGNYLNFEPNKADWDLCFLNYRWIYHEFSPPLLYNVVGTYINSDLLEVAVDSNGTFPFSAITPAHFNELSFNNRRDAIGFDWKVPVFGGATVLYRTRDYVNYFIRRKNFNEPELYKLRFIDFYNEKGVKGSPTFEIKRLQ
jgi:hypothetical protein